MDFSAAKTEEIEDEIELLTLLIEKYDEEYSVFNNQNPVELLKSLMKDHGLKSIDLARQLQSPEEFVWSPINVCCKLRLAWYVCPNTAIDEGFVPLVTRELVPGAQAALPRERRPGGKLDTRVEKLRQERERLNRSRRSAQSGDGD